MATRVWRNWARNQRCTPAGWHRPASEEELAGLIRRCHAAGERVRVVGSGHSWSPVVVTSGHLVSLDALDQVCSVDQQTGRVRVQGGARLKDLNEALAEVGLAFENLGSIAQQSIAGAISTGTHGSSLRHGNLATQVEALRLVDGTGRIHDLSREHRPDAFRAAVLSMGALGVITEVTLRCARAFRLREQAWSLRFDEAVARAEEISRSAEYVKLWWLPHTDKVQVYAADRVDDEGYQGPGRAAVWLDHNLLPHVFASVLGVGRLLPLSVPALNRLVSSIYFKDTVRVDRSDRILNLAMPPRHREAEYAIPAAEAGPAMAELRELVESERLRVNFILEVRFVKADDLPLSPDHGRDSCRLGIYIGEGRHLARYFEAGEALLLARGGRPHWGKELAVSTERLRALYPALPAVACLRGDFDPARTFINPFLETLFD